MNKYAQVYFNAYVNKMAAYKQEVPNDLEIQKEDEDFTAEGERQGEMANAMPVMSASEQEIPDMQRLVLPKSEMDLSNPKRTFRASNGPVPLNIQTGVTPAVPTMGLTKGNSSLAPSLQDRWSKYHGKGKANAYDPNSKRDVAMLKAMEAAQGGGEKAIRAAANGPLSRPAMRPARR